MRYPSPENEAESADFARAPSLSLSDVPQDDLPPETVPREIREAVDERLRQVRAGEFADEGAIEAIFRRAGA